MEVLSWQPRAFLWHGFMSESECLHIMRLARPQVLAMFPCRRQSTKPSSSLLLPTCILRLHAPADGLVLHPCHGGVMSITAERQLTPASLIPKVLHLVTQWAASTVMNAIRPRLDVCC